MVKNNLNKKSKNRKYRKNKKSKQKKNRNKSLKKQKNQFGKGNNYYHILVITTHGGILSKTIKEKIFTKNNYFDISKINAVTKRVCNLMDHEEAEYYFDNLKEILKYYDNTENLEKNIINFFMKFDVSRSDYLKINPHTQKQRESGKIDSDDILYRDNIEKMYEKFIIEKDNNFVDKNLTQTIREIKDEKGNFIQDRPYFDSVYLLTNNPKLEKISYPFNLMYIKNKMVTKSTIFNEVKLSEIYNYLSKYNQIEKLIVIDLSCNVIEGESDERSLRVWARNNIDFKYGGYKYF